MSQTRRQELVDLLSRGEISFDRLRRELGISVRLLDDDLHHIARSLRRGPKRLVVTPPRCGSCGFTFGERKHYHTPSRCPRCRHESIHATRLRVEVSG